MTEVQQSLKTSVVIQSCSRKGSIKKIKMFGQIVKRLFQIAYRSCNFHWEMLKLMKFGCFTGNE
jgi:hypothetical protein